MTKKPNKPKSAKPSRTLDGDDYDLLQSIESGEVALESVSNAKAEIAKLKRAASKHFAKDTRVSFRVSSRDLLNIKRMAAREGLPYQTYLASIIHKLTTGQMGVD